MSDIGHNCGLVVAHTLHDAYSFIKSLQHRGREAAGIAAIGDTIDVIKWKGRVSEFDITDLHKIMPSHKYHTFMAHVRYATSGRKEKILEEAHPHTVGGKVTDMGSHVMIMDCELAAVHNGQIGEEYMEKIDYTKLRTTCDTEKALRMLREGGLNEYGFLNKIPGAYTLAYADKKRKEVIVMRDRTGIKPGVLGWKDGKYGVASEDIAFTRNGGLFKEDLEPGFVYYLYPEGNYRKQKVIAPSLANCFFEWTYIAGIDAVLNGVSVRTVRQNLGHELAQEFKFPDAEIVTFLPRSPEVAATVYADDLGLPFAYAFYKKKNERSFQGSTLEDKISSISDNLYLLPEAQELRGKTIVLVDDSTIRGVNSRKARELLYDKVGVKKVYLLNYTPKIGIIGEDNEPRGCMFGVDMPPNDKFVVRQELDGSYFGDEPFLKNRTDKEISDAIGMPTYFLSREGLHRAYETSGLMANRLCTYCIGGKHPLK